MKLKIQMSFFVVVACFVANSHVYAATEDTVTLVAKNAVLKGKIKKESITDIDIDVKDKGLANYKPAEIISLEWDITEPLEFREGYNEFRNGNFGRAATLFGDLMKNTETLKELRPEAHAYLNYLHAESLYRGEKTKEAIAAFEKFTTDFKTSMYTTLAVSSMVDCAIMSGEFAKVPVLLSTLRQQGGEQKAIADYLEGKMLLAQKKTAEASASFGRAIAGSTVASTRGTALMGQASCCVQTNDLAKARELAQKALSEKPTHQVAAAANIVIGDAIMAEIAALKPPQPSDLANAYLDALLAYMRVPLLYKGDPNTEPKALYWSGEICNRLSKLPGRGSDRLRAVALFTKLTENPRYRGKEFTTKATATLQSFR